MAQVEQSLVCVRMCVRVITFDLDDLWPGWVASLVRRDTIWVSAKVKDIGQSSRSQEMKNVAGLVGATSSKGLWRIIPFQHLDSTLTECIWVVIHVDQKPVHTTPVAMMLRLHWFYDSSAPFTQYNLLSNGWLDRFDNRLYRVNGTLF